jgi:hypothetical protein
MLATPGRMQSTAKLHRELLGLVAWFSNISVGGMRYSLFLCHSLVSSLSPPSDHINCAHLWARTLNIVMNLVLQNEQLTYISEYAIPSPRFLLTQNSIQCRNMTTCFRTLISCQEKRRGCVDFAFRYTQTETQTKRFYICIHYCANNVFFSF